MPNHTKLLGDAGEHYALSMLSFAGRYAAKMPDNWKSYDLVVDDGERLARVSVKSRSQTALWTPSSHYLFDTNDVVDWFVFILHHRNGDVRSWVVPWAVAIKATKQRDSSSKRPTRRRVMFSQLLKAPFTRFEDNWHLSDAPSRPKRMLVRDATG